MMSYYDWLIEYALKPAAKDTVERLAEDNRRSQGIEAEIKLNNETTKKEF